MEHVRVNSAADAWRIAARFFPTDYIKNEESSKRAGYPIYETTSTDEQFSGFHISDLNTRLELNMGNDTVTIWIEDAKENAPTPEWGIEPEKIKLRYVYDMFVQRFGWLAKVITFEMFSMMVDEALEKMKTMLSDNKEVQKLVVGEEASE